MLDDEVGRYRKGTVYKVGLPTAPSLMLNPVFAELTQRQGEHDILSLEFNRVPYAWQEILKTGTPIVFSWFRGQRKSTWIGYVSLVSRETIAQNQQKLRVVCVGSSYYLKSKVSRVFKNKTVSEAVQTICKDFSLGYIGEPSPRRFEQLIIAGQSYWEWMHDYAAKIGYGFYVKNATVYFRPIDALLDAGIPSAPVFKYKNPLLGSGGDVPLGRSIDFFEAYKGDHIETGTLRNSKQVAGMNPITSAQYSAVGVPSKVGKSIKSIVSPTIFSDMNSAEVVHELASAKVAADGLAHNVRLNVPAKLIAQGDPRVAPYAVVNIQGTGRITDGYWVTKSVIHRFSINGEYSIQAELLTDGVGEDAVSPFRMPPNSRKDTVNLNEKLKLDSLGQKEVEPKLVTKVPQVSIYQQGVFELPALWSSK